LRPSPRPLGSVGYENKTTERGERYVWLASNVTSNADYSVDDDSLALAHWMPRLGDERFKIAVCGESEHLTSID
jgi:hypothetical protein